VTGLIKNVGMPPRSWNHRVPAACDTPTAIAASSLLNPLAISRQNNRSTSRRSDGFPGDFIGDLPVSSRIHPAGLPINTLTIGVLRRPVESALYPGNSGCAGARAGGGAPGPYQGEVTTAAMKHYRAPKQPHRTRIFLCDLHARLEAAEPLTAADRAELARRRAKAAYWAEVSARQRAAHGMTSW
jgi:hypothetical protein